MNKNIILAPYTSWLVGGPADFFCLPVTETDLRTAIEFAQKHKTPIHILGGGSNTLISDAGIRGMVICLKNFTGITTKEENGEFHLNCLAGTGKNELLKIFLKQRLAPALFLAGLPGDIGGGVVMNAGVAEQFVPENSVKSSKALKS